MNIIASTGKEEVAIVYIAEFGEGKRIELVESLQPPIPREEKWVLLVSSMFGCPVECIMCDAGGTYHGKLTKDEFFAQIDYLVYKRFPDGDVPSRQFKIQFARMGEPSLNPAVLDVLEELPQRYVAPGLMPSISTVAPCGTDRFFRRPAGDQKRAVLRGQFPVPVLAAHHRSPPCATASSRSRSGASRRWRITASSSTRRATARSRSTSPWQIATRWTRRCCCARSTRRSTW